MKREKKSVTTVASNPVSKSAAGSNAGKGKSNLMQDVSPNGGNSILERVKAFVNLKFTPTIEEMAFIKEEEDIKKVESVQL